MKTTVKTARVNQFVLDGLELKRGADEPLQEQILIYLRRCIQSGRLRSGSRIPSSRSFASALGASRTTVVEVYTKLEAEGLVVPRPRAGYFVVDQAHGRPSSRTQSARAAAAVAVERSPLAVADDGKRHPQLPLAPGIPAIDRFPWQQWTRLSAHVLRRYAESAFACGDPRGEPALREAVAEYLASHRGLCCHPDQVVIANGSQALVELLVRTVAKPGDRVWFEEPGDPASRAVLEALGLKPVPVPVDRHGMDVEAGLRLAPKARLVLASLSHHYPLAVTMSTPRRQALLAFSAATGAYVIENEIDCDFRFTGRGRDPLFALDRTERVVYLGSFNKSVAPGLRVGYAVLPEPLAARVAPRSPLVSVHQQLLLAKFWAGGHLATHLRKLLRIHAERRDTLLEALREHASDLLDVDRIPEAGLRIPAMLPAGVDDRRAASLALRAGLGLGRPVSACYMETRRRTGLTLGFASTPAESIPPAVHKLAEIVRQCASERQ